MKIAVLSDLHIGHSNETHQLGHSDHDFAKFLFELENKYDKIILLGDIFEVEMEIISNEKDTFKQAKKEHKTITKRFKSNKYIYVYGNHDLIGKEFGAIESYTLNFNNEKYIFTHGHQFDRIYQNSKQSLSFLGGVCLKLNLKTLYKFFSESTSSIREEQELFERKAIEFAKKEEKSIIVTGHTHDPKIIKEDITYINSGTCTYGRICYVHMDLQEKEFKLMNGETHKQCLL